MIDPCPGCGSTETLAALNAKGFVSCCPDRPGAPSYVEIDGMKNTPPTTEDKLRAALVDARRRFYALGNRRQCWDEVDAAVAVIDAALKE